MLADWLYRAAGYGVAASFGKMAASRALPRRARILIGMAGAFDAAATATARRRQAGGRAGLQRQLAVGGAALAIAGLLLRRERFVDRATMVGAGLSRFAAIGLAGALRRRLGGGPDGEPGYPPLDVPKLVAKDVFIVDSLLPGPLGRVLAARMTVFRLPDGGLLLHSPVRIGAGLRRALDRLGPVRHLAAPNIAHWMFLQEWQRAYPEAITWAAPGLRRRRQVRRSGVRLDHDLPRTAPEAWGGAMELAHIRGGLGVNEVAFFHRPTRTLALADLAMNLEARKTPLWLRPLLRLLGPIGPDGMPPAYLRAAFKLRRRRAAREARRLLALQPERVIFSHGRWFERAGTERLRRSLRWLIA